MGCTRRAPGFSPALNAAPAPSGIAAGGKTRLAAVLASIVLSTIWAAVGNGNRTPTIKSQRVVSGGLKAVTQTEKGLQGIFIRTVPGAEAAIAAAILHLNA